MADLVNTILNTMSSLNKPQKTFMAYLLAALMVFQGKATYRNLSRYSDMSEKRFSRWYRRAFPYAEFNSRLLTHAFPKEPERIAAIDASFMKKSGKKTEGLGWFYNGAQGVSERGLEVSLVCAVNVQANTAYSIDARLTLDREDQSRMDLYGQHIGDVASTLKRLNIRYVAADACYSKTKFVCAVTDAGFHMIGKLRTDANLKWFYTGAQKHTGRPRKFDVKVEFNTDLDRFERVTTLADGTEVYSAVVYSVSFKCAIRVVLLRAAKPGSEARAILFSTDLELDAQVVLLYYKARFQIEFLFRDAKQYTGLTHCQSLRGQAITNQVNASLTTLNVLKIEDQQDKQIEDKSVISIASWKRRKINQHLMSKVFDKFGLSLKSKKVADVYEELSHYGTIAA